jgi:GMP synthase (glutamine-hydrolysing)
MLRAMADERHEARTAKKIFIVKTGEPVPKILERRGEFGDLIVETIGDVWSHGYASFDARTDAPPEPRDVAAFVITGSAANVPDRAEWMLKMESYLRDVVALGVPTFGICFGHQILAQALGGEVRKNPRGREIGTRHINKLVHDPIFDGIPDVFKASVTHVDTVASLPPKATVLAKNDFDDHHAIRFTGTCYGVQFHPELDADVMRGYVEHRWDTLSAEGIVVDELHRSIEECEFGRRTLVNFVQHIMPRR